MHLIQIEYHTDFRLVDYKKFYFYINFNSFLNLDLSPVPTTHRSMHSSSFFAATALTSSSSTLQYRISPQKSED